MADHYVMVFHHADGHLIGEPSNCWIREHFSTCWDTIEPVARGEFILRRVIADRTTFLFQANGELKMLTLAEAVERILQLYKVMAAERQQQQQQALLLQNERVTVPAATLPDQTTATASSSLPNLDGGHDSTKGIAVAASSPPPPPLIKADDIIRIHYVRALKHLRKLIKEKEDLETQREAYDLAIARGRQYLARCRELAHRHREETQPQPQKQDSSKSKLVVLQNQRGSTLTAPRQFMMVHPFPTPQEQQDQPQNDKFQAGTIPVEVEHSYHDAATTTTTTLAAEPIMNQQQFQPNHEEQNKETDADSVPLQTLFYAI